jgi:hypothetical protein
MGAVRDTKRLKMRRAVHSKVWVGLVDVLNIETP